MRTQAQIRQQLKQVTFRHQKKRLRTLFKQRPDTCCHNREVELDADSHVYLCGFTSSAGEPRNVPCDARIPGCSEMARECPLWEPMQTKSEVKQEFQELMATDRGVIASKYPDIAALMWVLDEPGDDEITPDSLGPRYGEPYEDEPLDEDEIEPTWKWLLKKLRGGR